MPRPKTKTQAQSIAEYRRRAQKQIPLSYKKEIAERIYSHAKNVGSSPVTWIKEAIAEKYKKETGEDLQ